MLVSTKATYLNFYSGTGGTLFGNGAGVLSGASVNNAGDMVLKNINYFGYYWWYTRWWWWLFM
jgi:hypothetical protein